MAESGGKYFREARFFLGGDRVAAQSHIGEARQLLGYMRDQGQLGGSLYMVQHATLQDGTTIRGIMNNGQFQAEIISPPPGGGKDLKNCRSFWSGLLSVEQVAKRTRTLPSGVVEEYEVQEWLHTSAYHQQLLNDTTAKVAVESFAKVKENYHTVFSSDYSGTMRQAIQILLGMGERLVSAPLPPPWPEVYEYSFRFDGTHGLVQAHGHTDDNPALWLVRMPTAGYGILAMPYKVCLGVSKLQRDNNVHWLPEGTTNFPDDNTELDAAIANGSVLELISAAEMTSALGGYLPLYPDCGWAFSLSGHECQNVLYTDSGLRVSTKRFKVAFTRTPNDPNNPGKPQLSAEITSRSSEEFFGPITLIPRFPYRTPSITSLYPFDLAALRSGQVYSTASSSDVHVFYKGDTEQVFRFVYDAATKPTTWLSGNFWNGVTYLSSGANLCAGSYNGFNHAAGTVEIYYTLNGAGLNGATFTGSGTEHNFNMTTGGNGGLPTYVPVGGQGTFFSPWSTFAPGSALFTDNQYTKTVNSRVNFPLMMVPLHQREGVYILDAEKDDSQAHSAGPRTYRSTTSGDTWWELINVPDLNCNGGFKVILHKTHTQDTCRELPNVPAYADLPGVSGYSAAYGFGGSGLSALEGCYGDIAVSGPPPQFPVGVVVNEPPKVTWSGGMTFYSGGVPVSIFFGSSSALIPNNPVMAKILQIMSLDYIIQKSSVLLFGWNDGLNPNKYVIYNNINTVLGADTLTNTAYPTTEMNNYGKSFVGIAN